MHVKNNKALIMIGLIIGIIFSELDETVVSTALPTIIRDLHGLALYGWVAGVYMLAMTSFIPILGKLADLYGRKSIYVLSMSLFIAGSIVSGFAGSMPALLIGRGIQGIGAGGLMPLAMVIFGDTFTVAERAKLQGAFGAIMFIPQLLGPLVGGYLTQHISWHWIFWVNIPVGIIAAAVLSAGLREQAVRKEHASIDWAGAFLLVGAIVSLLLTPVLHQNQGYAWNSSVLLSLWIVGAILLALFIFVESKAQEPILPLHLFRNRTFVVVSLLVFTMVVGMMGSFAAFPFYAQNVIGLTPIASGYLTLPLMIGAVLSSVVTGRFMTKVPYRSIFAISLLFPIAGFYLMTGIDIHTRIIAIIGYFVVLGLGFGAMFNNNLIIQESVPKEQSGVALSSVTLFQSIGMTIGLSIFGSLLASRITSGLGALAGSLPAGSAGALGQAAQGGIPKGLDPGLTEQIKTVFADAFHHLYWISFALAIVVVLLSLFMNKEVLTANSVEANQAEVHSEEVAPAEHTVLSEASLALAAMETARPLDPI